MAKIKRIRFTVEGSCTFPFDMLRYDHAWPETENLDSRAIGLSFEDGDEFLRVRHVTLLTDSPHAPTAGRWKSHGWRVISSEVVR